MRVLACIVALSCCSAARADGIAVEPATPDAVAVADPGIWPAIGAGVGASIALTATTIVVLNTNSETDNTGALLAVGGAMLVLPVLGAVLGAVVGGAPDTALPAAGGALFGELSSTCVCGCIGFGIGGLLVGWIPFVGPALATIVGAFIGSIAALVGFVPFTAVATLVATELYRGVPLVLGLLNPSEPATTTTTPTPTPTPTPTTPTKEPSLAVDY